MKPGEAQTPGVTGRGPGTVSKMSDFTDRGNVCSAVVAGGVSTMKRFEAQETMGAATAFSQALRMANVAVRRMTENTLERRCDL